MFSPCNPDYRKNHICVLFNKTLREDEKNIFWKQNLTNKIHLMPQQVTSSKSLAIPAIYVNNF